MTADATNEVKANWEQPASASFAQWMESRVARFSTRKYDFDALKFQADFDPKYRRGQMRYIGTGGTGVGADSNTIPADHFTFSTMVIPAGHEGPPHLHVDVEEVFFLLRGKLRVVLEKDGERFETIMAERDVISVPPGVYREEINIGDEDALICVMLGSKKPVTPPTRRALRWPRSAGNGCSNTVLNVTMIGCGAIGSSVLELIANEPSLAIRSVVTSTAHMEQARVAIGKWAPYANVLEELAGDTPPDLVVECAGHAAIKQHVVPALARGIPCIVTSVGALSAPGMYEALEAAARAGKTQVQLISGAIGGIDALAAAKYGGLTSVIYTARKPPKAWKSTPAEEVCDLDALTTACCIFNGTAQDAAQSFPQNANVAATLACRDRTGKNAGATICRSFGVRKHSPFRGCGGIRLLRAHFTRQASSGQPQDLITHRVQRGEGLAKPQRRCLNLNAPNLQEKTLGYF